MSNSKKCISSVIAMSLLIVVTVFAAFSFQTWYQSYSSSMFVDLEDQSVGDFADINVETIIGNDLYVKNSNSENLLINKIVVDGEVCYENISLVTGISNLSLDNCNFSSSTPNVVIMTDNKIIEESFYVPKKLIIESENATTNTSNQLSSLNNGLLTYYPLDNFSRLNSTIGYVQTLIEEPYGVIQKSNYVEFTLGQDSSFNTPGNSTNYMAPGFTHNWSLSQWFYTDDLTGNSYQNLWHQRVTDFNSNYGAVIFNSQSDEICITYAGGDIYPIICSQSVVGEGTWHHLVTMYEEFNSTYYNWTLYLDEQGSSVLSTRRSNVVTYLNFGDWDASGNYILEGGMRDIGIWNRVLTEEEIQNLYSLNDSFLP